MTWTIVTSIFGGYDRLEPPTLPQNARMLCITDTPCEVDGWAVLAVDPPHTDQRRASRHVKLLTHLYVDGPTIFVDPTMNLKGDLVALAETCGEMAIPRHSRRSCVYEEIDTCIRRRKDHPDELSRQGRRYLDAGMPRGFGLWECGIIVRRPSERVEEFCGAWWDEYNRGSCRDQIALPFVAWRDGYRPETIEMSVWKNDVCEVRQLNGRVSHGLRK